MLLAIEAARLGHLVVLVRRIESSRGPPVGLVFRG